MVNPFPAKPGSEHDRAQRVTFASMRRAVAEAEADGPEVEVVAAILPGDEAAVEPPTRPAAWLERTVTDLAAFKNKRPLPLVGDLLRVGAEAGADTDTDDGGGNHEPDYLIYTNIDIALQPHFYRAVADKIETLGRDRGFVINRRTIPAPYAGPDDLEAMYHEPGERHPGWDCFVFPMAWVSRMDLGDSCIGSLWFAGLLLANMDILSGFRSVIYRDDHLTFHIGDDKQWVSMTEYEQHNLNEAVAAMSRLTAEIEAMPQSSFTFVYQRRLAQACSLKYRVIRRMKRFPFAVRLGRAVRSLTQ